MKAAGIGIQRNMMILSKKCKLYQKISSLEAWLREYNRCPKRPYDGCLKIFLTKLNRHSLSDHQLRIRVKTLTGECWHQQRWWRETMRTLAELSGSPKGKFRSPCLGQLASDDTPLLYPSSTCRKIDRTQCRKPTLECNKPAGIDEEDGPRDREHRELLGLRRI